MIDQRGKAMITGVSGLVGFHLAEQLCLSTPRLEVVGICRTPNDNTVDLQSHPNFRLVAADVTEPAGYARELEGVGTLYHLAAQSTIYKARGDPLGDLRINVQGTLQLALCAVEAGVQKLVFTSGGAVYASQNYAREDLVGQPPSIYGVSKLAAESYIRVVGSTQGLRFSILRLARVYGPRMTRGALYDLTQDLQAGQPANMFAHPDSILDFVYVRDVVSALLLASGPEWDGVTANVSSGEGTRLRDLHSRFEAFTGRKLPLKEVQGIPVVDVLMNDRARSLGWAPLCSLDTGIAETLPWLLRGR